MTKINYYLKIDSHYKSRKRANKLKSVNKTKIQLSQVNVILSGLFLIIKCQKILSLITTLNWCKFNNRFYLHFY